MPASRPSVLPTRRHYLWAFACLVVAALAYYLFERYSLVGPFGWLGHLSALLTSWLLAPFNIQAHADGPALASTRFALVIAPGCSPVPPFLLYAAAVVAFPAPLLFKLMGLLFGAIALFALNVVRLFTLFIAGQAAPQYLDLLHDFLWQLAMVAAILTLWFLWVRRLPPVRSPLPPPQP